VPKSRVRQKTAYVPPPSRSASKKVSPPWVAITMVALFVLGIAWLAVYYVSGGNLPGFSTLGNWNLAIGFALLLGGFGFATQWH
jgi:hypothetical protein